MNKKEPVFRQIVGLLWAFGLWKKNRLMIYTLVYNTIEPKASRVKKEYPDWY
jgi:hypothetical protein